MVDTARTKTEESTAANARVAGWEKHVKLVSYGLRYGSSRFEDCLVPQTGDNQKVTQSI